MKVLVITPYLGSNYGGISKIVVEQCQTLKNQDITLDVVTTNANTTEKLEQPLNVWLTKNNYRIKYFDCWHRNDFIISFRLINWVFNNVANYDLVHIHTIFAPMISLITLVCQFRKIPYVVAPHGMLEPWALAYKAWKKTLYFNLLEKSSLTKAQAIHVTGSSENEHIKSLGFKNSVLIPNGIARQELELLPDPEIFYQQFPGTRNKTLILFLGRIDPKKGLDLLAPAFAKVRDNFPEIHLVIAGPDSIGFMSTVKDYFSQVGCLDAVTFTGMLTGSLKYAALAVANLYIAPSYSEGFSMSILEGMASGLPCIITTGCNFPEAANAKVAHVVDINANAIANALTKCLKYPQQAKLMGIKARKFIFKYYTWNHSAKKLTQVYNIINNSKYLHNHNQFDWKILR
ncbi:MAG: glycosyltransferase [Calothrix sp. SM1_7_51]|nr:glycosyltransferase [Calothrix sp. SM1_7_51]